MNPSFLISQFEKGFKASLEAIRGSVRALPVSDIFIQFNPQDETIRFYDDNDAFLSEIEVKGLNEERAVEKFVPRLRDWLNSKHSIELLATIEMLKPFSVVLVDENLIEIEDLLLLDDDTIVVNDELLERIDRELNDFIDNLLGDIYR